MHQLGLIDLRVDDVIVDTVRVLERSVRRHHRSLARRLHRRAGASHALTAEEVRELFDYSIETIRDPQQYAAWHIPVVGGRKALSGARRHDEET